MFHIDSGIVLQEGKSCVVHAMPNLCEVVIENKDEITAHGGKRRDVLPGKGALTARIAANCFSLLERAGMYTHYLGPAEDNMFRARRLGMLPLEVVVRRFASGSYLRRHPDVLYMTRFETPEIEIFDKRGGTHDPLLVWDRDEDAIRAFRARDPLAAGCIEERSAAQATDVGAEYWSDMIDTAHAAFAELETAWATHNATLADLKLEFGTDLFGQLTIGDVLDPGTWRLWRNGDPVQPLDKQAYREGYSVERLAEVYAWTAAKTDCFVQKTV